MPEPERHARAVGRARDEDQRQSEGGQHRQRDHPQPQAQAWRQRTAREKEQQGRAGEIGDDRHADDHQPDPPAHASSTSRTSAATALTIMPATMMCQVPGTQNAITTASAPLASPTSRSAPPCSWDTARARNTAGKAKSSPQRAGSDTSPPRPRPTRTPATNDPLTARTLPMKNHGSGGF